MESIVYGLSNEQYHHGEEERQYISSSQLKKLAVSPKFFHYCLDNPEPQTDAMRLGSLFHDLMACSAEHYDNGTKALTQWLSGIAVFNPPVNEKTGAPYGTATKAYKEAHEAFLQANEGKTIATDEELSQVQQMHQAVLLDCGATSEQVRKLLKWGKKVETSYFYEDENGIKLKVRPDLLTRDKLIDWKTCSLESLNEESIARQIITYGYHISLSMYQFVLHEITGKWYTPMLVFIQKSAPFDCVIADISEWCYQYDNEYDIVSMGVGALEFKRLYDLYTECKTKDEWPGIESAIPSEGKTKIMKPAVPTWYGMKILNE